MKLPLEISCELKKRGRLTLCKKRITSAACWGVSVTALFVIGSRSKLFHMQTQPVLFWSVFAILLVLPILCFKFYRLVAYPEVTGMVSKLETGTCFGGKRRGIRGDADDRNGSEPGQCEVTVLDKKGRNHVFSLSGVSRTSFVQEYYQVGDVVHHPRFARYPFNESRLPPSPFCLCCGHIGTAGERKCPDCGAPLVPDRVEEQKMQNPWEYRNGY